MTDLPRYMIWVSDAAVEQVKHEPDGAWVKWADVSARLQQLEGVDRMLAVAHRLHAASSLVVDWSGIRFQVTGKKVFKVVCGQKHWEVGFLDVLLAAFDLATAQSSTGEK